MSTIKDTDREQLIQEADSLQIKYPKNVSTEKLKELIAKASEESQVMTEEELEQLKKRKVRSEALKLIRVIVNPVSPDKTGLNGEIFTVGNGVIGTVKRFVPYNNPNGWHIENIIYKMLCDAQHQLKFMKKGQDGKGYPDSRLVPAYNITVLPPLTKEEIKKLEEAQTANRSTENE